MYPALVALAFQRLTEVAWFFFGGLHDFLSYKLATGTVHGYPTRNPARLKRQESDNDPIVPVLARTTAATWLQGLMLGMIFNFNRDYRQYHGVIDDAEGSAN